MLKYIQFKSTYYLLSLTGSYSFKSWFEIKCSKCTKASWRHHQCREDSAPIQLQCCRSWPGPSCRGQRSRWGGSHQLAPSQLPTQRGWPHLSSPRNEDDPRWPFAPNSLYLLIGSMNLPSNNSNDNDFKAWPGDQWNDWLWLWQFNSISNDIIHDHAFMHFHDLTRQVAARFRCWRSNWTSSPSDHWSSMAFSPPRALPPLRPPLWPPLRPPLRPPFRRPWLLLAAAPLRPPG